MASLVGGLLSGKLINTVIKWTCVGGGAVLGLMIGPTLAFKAILGIAGGVGGYFASTLLPDMSKTFDAAKDALKDIGGWAKGAVGDIGKSFDEAGDFIGKGAKDILGKVKNIPKIKIKVPKIKIPKVKIPKLKIKLW